jgi:multiple sugar transport system permease protein
MFARPPQLSRDDLAGWLLVLPVVAMLGVFLALPMIEAVTASAYETSLITDETAFAGWANYREVLASGKIGSTAWTTALWTAASLAGQLVLGLVAALALERMRRGARLLRGILLLPYAMPAISLALAWRWLFSDGTGILTHWLQQLGVVAANTSPLGSADAAFWLVVLANVWHGFPFAMLIYWAALTQIDRSLYEAAALDGAGAWASFRFVTVPALKAATVGLLVLRGIWTATSFDLVWLTTGGGPAGATYTWPIWIYEEALGFFRPGRASVLAIALGVTLLSVLVLLRRRIAASLQVD